jgi:hypothetical protein
VTAVPADPFEERLRAGLGRLASDARVSADARERLHRRAQREPIRRIGVVIASYAMVVVAAAALVVGTRFSGDDRTTAVRPGPASSTGSSSSTSTTTSTTRAPAAGPSSTSGGTATTTTPTTPRTDPSPTLGPGFSTEPRRSAGTGQPVPPLPRAVRLDAGRHDDEGFDRVVVEFDGDLPGYEIGYVSRVVQDGSGEPVSLLGSADLQIRITPADAHDDAGRSTLPVSRLTPDFRTVREVRLVSDFEGYVTIGVGTAGRRPFRVSELSGPSRLVIDFAQAG